MSEHEEKNNETAQRNWLTEALPYIAPFAVFALITLLANPDPQLRPLLYILKVIAVGAVLWSYRGVYTEIKPAWSWNILPAAGAGLVMIVFWIALDPWYPQSAQEFSAFFSGGLQVFEHAEKLEGQFDPYIEGSIIPPAVAIFFRIGGAVLLVPIFEELFHRSWLIRYLVRENFRSVPMGTFTWGSFLGTVALFAITHHEWLAAIICAVLLNLLLYWKKDIFLCMVAHATANLALAVWVLTTDSWHFW